MELNYLKMALEGFKGMKNQAEKAMEQLSFEELRYRPNEGSNSIDIIVRHMSGNLRSRFKDFLTTDGEKPDRNRDGEFEGAFASREQLMETWNAGWEVLFSALSELHEQDLLKTVLIRREPHSVMEAIQRQIIHQSGHVGQIVYLAKLIKDDQWNSLSIPKGKSAEFNKKMNQKFN